MELRELGNSVISYTSQSLNKEDLRGLEDSVEKFRKSEGERLWIDSDSLSRGVGTPASSMRVSSAPLILACCCRGKLTEILSALSSSMELRDS